jgi:NSS family neurotransmitter:Na+ symporter
LSQVRARIAAILAGLPYSYLLQASSVGQSLARPKAEENREQWHSNLGFIFAAIGSAVGIGNIWRFPYIVGTNGGGAFLVTYVIVIFSFGLAFMVLEIAIGRYYQTSILSAFERIRRRFKWIGVIMIGITFAILSYYLVILGWVISYFVAWTATGAVPSFEEYTGSIYPIIAFFAMLAVNFGIISLGVHRGIENLSKVGVILLLLLMIPLTAIGLYMDGSEKGLEFYLSPDFSRLSDPEVWSIAFGQAFFSLSVGMGVLLVYGSYLRETHSIIKASIIIIVADLAVAFLAGLMIFSFVFSYGLAPDQGASLVFRVMPTIFTDIPGFGVVLGSLFFLLVLLAGLTSSISMFEVPVSALEDTFRVSRIKAAAIVSILLSGAGILPALSYSGLASEIGNIPFFDLYDLLFGTYGITISGAIFSIVATWFMDRTKLLEQVNLKSPFKVPPWVLTIVKFTMPLLIMLTMATQIAGLFSGE